MAHRRRRWGARLAALLSIPGLILLIPGRAPATIAEQRQRLPPPAFCDDPVEGEWKSHQYDPRFRDWYIFTLEIRRVEGSETQLTGQIRSRSWNGTPQEEEPPPCRPGLWHWTVLMPAEGSVSEDGFIRFGGTSWRNETNVCGSYQPTGYNEDQFSGRIDPELMEFQSVNNDGGRAVNVPTVFRRVRCFDNTVPAPSVNPQPPPFYPGRQASGCGVL